LTQSSREFYTKQVSLKLKTGDNHVYNVHKRH
jgi:hypothetical protein